MADRHDIARLYVNDGLSSEQVAQQAELYGPLAEDVRDLVQLSIQTLADEDAVAQARNLLAQARKILAENRETGPYGVHFSDSGEFRPWGNAVMGLRNPIAPPVQVVEESDGSVWAEFTLHAGYEGPAGHTHGGVLASILDQVLGDAARHGGSPGMTGTLTVRYRRPARLGDLRADARIDRVEGSKAFVVGTISDAEGVCCEAEGIFITPKWMEAVRDVHVPGTG